MNYCSVCRKQHKDMAKIIKHSDGYLFYCHNCWEIISKDYELISGGKE